MEACRNGLAVSVNSIIVGAAEETDRNGRPLPVETRNYLTTLAPIIGAQQDGLVVDELPRRPQDWRETPLFSAPPVAPMEPGETGPQSSEHRVAHGMFVPPSEPETP